MPQHGLGCKNTELAEPMWKHSGRSLLMPVKADQSQHNGLFQKSDLKETGTDTERSDKVWIEGQNTVFYLT